MKSIEMCEMETLANTYQPLRQCSICEKHLPLSSYGRQTTGNKVLKKNCRRCDYERHGRKRHYEKNYGLTEQEYHEMLSALSFKCPACNKEHDENQRLVVDHCHDSGKVRGLLCLNCNFALGYAKDSPSVLRKLADYLEKPNGS
jgi:hypothetical protein